MWENPDGTSGTGMGKTMDVTMDNNLPFVAAVLSERVFREASRLSHYSVDIYNEILKNCPLLAWKDDMKSQLF